MVGQLFGVENTCINHDSLLLILRMLKIYDAVWFQHFHDMKHWHLEGFSRI